MDLTIIMYLVRPSNYNYVIKQTEAKNNYKRKKLLTDVISESILPDMSISTICNSSLIEHS